MPSAAEAVGQQSVPQAVLDAGVELISVRQTVQFELYTKIALAPDSFIFWVATGQVITVTGALHYSTDRIVDLDQTLGANQVLFTSEEEVTQFNGVAPTQMWIGSWPIDGAAPLRVAFAKRGLFFGPAKLWHYSGYAVYPALESQILQSAADLPAGPLVSNSLPIWLAQNALAPVYPSFAVPDNVVPPYIVAHVEPARTQAIGPFPVIGPWPGTIIPNSGASPLHRLAVSQLCRDEVTLVLYGFTNDLFWQYYAALLDYSEATQAFGFALPDPVVSDAKRVQVEIAALAQKKTFVITANYYQGSADAIARRLILEAMCSFQVVGGVTPVGVSTASVAPLTMSATGMVFQ